MDNEKEILNGVQSQISSFDNKASILLSVVGIIFGLTLSFLDVFHAEFFEQQSSCFRNWYSTLFILYVLVTIVLIIFLILVIFPRKNKNGLKSPDYYLDINSLTKEELNEAIKKNNENNGMILDQIKNNSKICSTKHFWLKSSIILFLPFVLLIFVMILMTIFA